MWQKCTKNGKIFVIWISPLIFNFAFRERNYKISFKIRMDYKLTEHILFTKLNH